MTDRGCVFFSFGEAYGLRLLVAVSTLREVYAGPVAVFLAPDATGRRLESPLRELGCDVSFEEHLSKSCHRHRVFARSPYAATLMLDADMIFQAPLDPLWEPLEREGLLVTRFSLEPYGIDGTPESPGFANRVGHMQPLRPLVDADLWREAVRRLVEERIDVNIGVMGVARPAGDAFLADYSELMERGLPDDIALLDEMLTVALLPRHRHALMGEEWNCPADEYFRGTHLPDAKVIHYFADGMKVHGRRLGRNPATWAGRKWWAAYERAAAAVDLAPFEAGDRGFQRLKRAMASRDGGRSGRRSGRGLRTRIRRAIREEVAAVMAAARHRHVQGKLRRMAERGERVSIAGDETATAVVLSYNRPQNIAPIVRSLLLCDFVERVVVSNNNPDVDLGPHLDLRDARLDVIEQAERRGPAYRYDLCRLHPAEHYLCVDDDVFPDPWQLAAMFEALLADPSVPRGIDGQVFDARKGLLVDPAPDAGAGGAWPADVILQVYVFTRAHLDRYFELVAAMGKANEEIHSSEDVILSFAGEGRPVVDTFEFLYECPSARQAEVATWAREGFDAFRNELFHTLREVR